MRNTETIAEVGLNAEGRTFVRPRHGDFEHVYRAGMEIYWNAATRQLSHPAPRNWSPTQWFQQIVAAIADEYSVALELDDQTIWTNIPANLQREMEAIITAPPSRSARS